MSFSPPYVTIVPSATSSQTPSAYGYSSRKIKSKAIPRQARTGPEGSRKFRLPDFKTICT